MGYIMGLIRSKIARILILCNVFVTKLIFFQMRISTQLEWFAWPLITKKMKFSIFIVGIYSFLTAIIFW